MYRSIALTILGEPIAKQSFKIGRNGIKYKPTKARKAEENIRAQVINQLPEGFSILTGGIKIKIVYWFSVPSSMPKKLDKSIEIGNLIPKLTKPDVTDNLNKGLCDALEGIVYVNDSQIYSITAGKYYTKNNPRTVLQIVQTCEKKNNFCHFETKGE